MQRPTVAQPDPAAGSVALAALAIGLALVSLTIGFGAIDLLSPWILHEGTQVTDVGYGTLAGLVIPIGLLAQVRSPGKHLAGLQQVGVAAAAFLVAGALAGELPLVVAAAVVAVATTAIAALHPGRRRLVRRPGRPDPLLLALGLIACVPGAYYVLDMASNERHGVLPADAHLGLRHWAALSAAALAVLLTALLASLPTDGFAIPGRTAALAVLVWGLVCLVYPDSGGAVGPVWAGLAIAWAIGFAALLEWRKPEGLRDSRAH